MEYLLISAIHESSGLSEFNKQSEWMCVCALWIHYYHASGNVWCFQKHLLLFYQDAIHYYLPSLWVETMVHASWICVTCIWGTMVNIGLVHVPGWIFGTFVAYTHEIPSKQIWTSIKEPKPIFVRTDTQYCFIFDNPTSLCRLHVIHLIYHRAQYVHREL